MRWAVLVCVLVCACSSTPVKPEDKPVVSKTPITTLIKACKPNEAENTVKCGLPEFSAGVLGCIDIFESFGLCRNDLKSCQAMNLVDVEELKASVEFERREKEAAKSARWWWGLGGVGVGAVVVGLLVGLLR